MVAVNRKHSYHCQWQWHYSSVPLQFVHSPACTYCLLQTRCGRKQQQLCHFSPVVPKVSGRMNVLCQCAGLQVNSFAIDQCLEVLRKTKYLTRHQRKSSCHSGASVEVSQLQAGCRPRALCKGPFLLSISLTSPKCTGSEAKGMKMEN